jgi:gp19
MREATMCEKTALHQPDSTEQETLRQTENEDKLEDDLFKLQFNLGRSIRYHSRRRKFFDFWDKFTTFCSLVFSSTATYGVLSTNGKITLISGAFVTIFSSLSLVIGFSNKARDHFDFVKQYSLLERMSIKEVLSEKLLKQITDEKLSIESTEPPVLRVLNEMCWNEEAKAQGIKPEKWREIKWYQRLFSSFFDIVPESIK